MTDKGKKIIESLNKLKEQLKKENLPKECPVCKYTYITITNQIVECRNCGHILKSSQS